MDYKEMAEAVKLCGSVKGIEECKKCHYWKGPDMAKCIPHMTDDAATAIIDLLARAEEAEARAEKAEMERDAAVNDLGRIKSCKVCNHCDSLKTLIPEACKKCHHGDKWEWRGQKEE